MAKSSIDHVLRGRAIYVGPNLYPDIKPSSQLTVCGYRVVATDVKESNNSFLARLAMPDL